eukprot:TRINITY_DN2438_c0_g1_i1.p1 TRINITY_DN2438_c0_g1~~TRINITY_DN2438_c0_g1_i1.p1  ORF type:complete len:341 (-),score=62.66 TRINITY_DN2438_c0_g1_i1:230-1252(-)
MKGCHFVLFFDGRHNSSDQLLLNNNDPIMEHINDHIIINETAQYREQQLFRQNLLYFFLEKRVKYISICESGYAGIHELVVGNLELIDHVTASCIECNGKWKNSLLSSLKGRFNNLISVAGGSMEKLRNRISLHSSNENNGSNDNNDSNDTKFKILSNNYSRHPIHDIHIHLCSNQPLLMIYLSILRNRDTKNVDKFRDITHKLLVLMFAQIFNFHFMESNNWSEIECVSPSDITYGSIMCQRGIYGVCLNDCCQNALQNLLHSFQPIIRSVIGTLKVEESFIEDKDGIIRSNRQCIALMPKDIDKRIVIIFHDSFNNEVHCAIDALLKIGSKNRRILSL